jgi:sortase (surface protein transpeptidase)
MPEWTRLPGGGRRRLAAPAAAAVLALAGLGAIGAGLAAQQHAPQPPASAALPAARSPQPTSPGPASPATVASSPPSGPVLPAAVPTELSIPAIGVRHSLVRLGENRDGTLQVPPLSEVATPGWDRYSPAPGQLGPSVIVGHVDSAAAGQGVFYNLGALRPGDTVSITRADRTVAVFRIVGVNKYPKSAFPTLKVYGNTPDAQLRLITCGGQFDPRVGSYLDNIVAYATLISSHRA